MRHTPFHDDDDDDARERDRTRGCATPIIVHLCGDYSSATRRRPTRREGDGGESG